MLDWDSIKKANTYVQPKDESESSESQQERKIRQGYLPKIIDQAKQNFRRNFGIDKETVDRQVEYTEFQKDIIKNTNFGKVGYGFMRGALPLNTDEVETKLYGQEIKDVLDNSKAAKAGEIAGIITQFAGPYAAAAPKIGSMTARLPGVAKMGNLGQNVVKSIATDLAVGLPLNVNYAYNKEGLEGTDALKNIGANTAIDILAGGVIEVVPVAAKAIKSFAKKQGWTEDAVSQAIKQGDKGVTEAVQQEMTELERLAYESNIRKGKITPQGNTLYGNAPQPIAGQLPGPPADWKPAKAATTDEEAFTNWRKEHFGGAFGKMSGQDMQALRELYSETMLPNYSTAAGAREVPRTVTPNELPQLPGGKSMQSVAEPKLPGMNGQMPTQNKGIRAFDQQETVSLSSKKGYVNGKDMDFKTFIQEAKTGKDSKKFYFGKVSDNLAKSIQDATGIDLKSYNVSIRSDEVRHIFGAHGDHVTEAARGQVAVNDKILENLPAVFNSPDEIKLLGTKDHAGRQALEISKRIKGYAITINGVSDGQKSLFIDSLRVVNKKKPLHTPDVLKPQTATPETSMKPASSTSYIPQNEESINNQNVTGFKEQGTDTPTSRDNFEAEFREKFERNYQDYLEDTKDYGDPTGETGIKDFAANISSKGVGSAKDIQRNADAAFRNSPAGRKWFKENFEDGFYKSKGRYTNEVKGKLDDLYDNVVKDLGIKKGSKESAAVQWIGEGKKQRTSGKDLSTETVPYNKDDLIREFDYTMPNGKKAWENIIEAEKWMRKTYDGYIGRINVALKEIYPDVEQNLAKLQKKAENAPLQIGAEIKAKTRGNIGTVQSIQGNTVMVHFKNKVTGKEAYVPLPRDEIISAKIAQEMEDAVVGKRLQPRQDYFRHFQEQQQKGLFVGIDNIINGATNIDPRLIGVSEFTHPKSRWTGFLQRRKDGDIYTEDAIGGMLEYIPQAEYKINIEPNIPKLRSMIKDLKESTINSRNANAFIDELMQFTSDLAGKTNDIDRGFLKLIKLIPLLNLTDDKARKVMNGLSTVSNRMRANAVVGNVNTMIAQFFNLPNVVGYAKNPVDLAQGFTKSIKASMGDPETKALLNKSMFLKERYLDRSFRRFDESILNNANRFFSWAMELGDKAVADGAWLTFYDQAIKKGLPETEAILKADELTRKAVAGRGIGEMPLSQKAKVTKLFMPFQVEVLNAVNVLGDLASKKDIMGAAGVFITSFILNEALGTEIGFNPIGVTKDAVQKGENVGTALLGNALINMPGGSYVVAALMGSVGADNYEMQKIFGSNDPSRFGTGNIALQTLLKPAWDAATGQNIDLVKPLAATLPKFGGRQIERGIRGLQDMAVLPKEQINLSEGVSLDKQDFPASYSPSGRLRFPIEPTAENYIKAPLLGTWSTKEGKEYIESGASPLGDKQTELIKKANEMGVSPLRIAKSYRGLSDLKDANGEKTKKKDDIVRYLKSEGLTKKEINLILEQKGMKPIE